MREKIWLKLRSYMPVGVILPKWMVFIYAVLFPVKYLVYKANEREGYQLMAGYWLIGGVKYSDEFFHTFSKANGGTYKIWRNNETVTIQRVI